MTPGGANAPIMQDDPIARVVLVLAKAPVAGRAKTRLTPPATPQGAARIAAAALLDTLDAAAAVPGARVLVALEGDLADAERGDEIAEVLAVHSVVRQRGDALGERIEAVHADAAELFPGAATVQVGMDTPQLDAALLDGALRTVESGTPAGIGIAHDGGWWALALRDPRRAAIISTIPTSRDDTGARTLAALRDALGHDAVAELDTLSDVDTADDAVAVADLAPDGRFARAVAELLGDRDDAAPLRRTTATVSGGGRP
ncbi:TIGR04282 family arsenosugar biosynthesis glycosyltransferase [Actinomycetospora sp. CA-084318]|uniref:TIGR04282 family arsenosugar biosynthesis glycosyltransferase n=1 Tax=Actinomycetospora sp. CA-084318 TaxID=3239892 RepID=UPI003D95C9B2